MTLNHSSFINGTAANVVRRAIAGAVGCGLAIVVPLALPSGAAAFGTFGTVDSHATGGNVSQAGVGDLDGDGALDIAASNDAIAANADSLLVYFGNGDGTLDVPVPIGVGEDPGGVAVNRFSGDRRQDVAVANYSDGTISLLYGTQGGVKHGPTLDTPDGPFLLASSDLDRDGRPDLLSINHLASDSRGLSVWMQRRGGGFGPRRDYAVPGSMHGLAVGRLNSDKRPDVATLTYGDDVSVRLTRKNGTLGPQRVTSGPSLAGFADLVIADFNRDGKGDVAAGDSTGGKVRVRLGRGNGSFRKPETVDLPGLSPDGVVAGDFNRDGKADLAVGSYLPAEVVVLRGKGNGKFASPSSPYPAGSKSFWLGTARLNADKGSDLLLGGSSSLDVFLNQP